MCKHHFKIAVFRISYGKNRSMIGFKKSTNFKFSLFVFFLLTIIFNCNMPKSNSCDVTSGICSPADTVQKNMKPVEEETTSGFKLIYFYDPLCGWCFGFSPVMTRLQEVYGDRLEIEVVSGGLFLGPRAGAVNAVAPHIKAGAYKSVELTTGVKFGKPFLDDVFGDGKITLNSLQPTIALSIVKEESPEHELRFAAMLLEHVYVDGIDPTDIEALAACAAKIGFDPLAFETKMKSFEYENAAKAEFKTFRNNKFSAMPALVLIKNGTEHQISHGYMNFEDLKTKLDSFLF